MRLGLTHTQLRALREGVKSDGAGNQGKQRTAADNARLVHSFGVLTKHLSISLNKAISIVAEQAAASPATVRQAVLQYREIEQVATPFTQHLGRGNPNHPLHNSARQPTEEEVDLLERLIDSSREKGHYHSLTTLRASLIAELKIEVTKAMLYRWLQNAGFSFEHKRFVGSLPPELKRALTRSFIYKLAIARREEEEGSRIIVFMDESYIHSAHNTKKFWCRVDQLRGRDAQGTDGGGTRLMIIHAMTRYGLMADPECLEANNNLTETFPTCEVVFEEVGTFNGDYHKCFDGEKFISWVKYRLLPTLAKLFPGRKMTLVMDNASYHKPAGIHTIRPYKMTAPMCVSFFADRHIRSIEVPVDDGVVTMPLSQFRKNAPHGPNVKQKQKTVKRYLKKNPGISITQMDEIMLAGGHQVLWTPPYMPNLQPIELLWARIKNAVARLAVLKRKPIEARRQTEAAFGEVQEEDCEKLVRHVEQWISEWMKQDDGGMLQQYGSFEDLVENGPHVDPTPPESLQEESSDEEDED
jgi:hypothetical protein